MAESGTRVELVWPTLELLPAYRRALERGWSSDNVRGAAAASEQLVQIAADPAAFVDRLVDREAKGGPVTLPDGGQVERLPGYVRWIWEPEAREDDGGGFCGVIGFRWQPGSSELPPHVLGHIGYTIVPWKRRRGHATQALRLQLTDARAEGLAYVTITTDPGNAASQRVIERSGGVLVERFSKPAAFGGGPGLRYRIDLRG